METPGERKDGQDAAAGQGLTHRALGGMFWILSSSWLQSLLRIGVVAVLARLLVPEDFGLMGAALIVIGVADMSSMLGVGQALVQLPAITSEHVRTGFTVSVLFGFFLAAATWLGRPLIAGFFGMPGLVPVLGVLAWSFPLQAVSQISGSLIQRDLRYRRLAGVDVVSYGLGYGCLGIGLAVLDYGVWALVWANMAATVVKSAILLKLQPHAVGPRIRRAALKDLSYFGTGFTAVSVLNYIARKGDNLVVGRWLGAGALGIYGRAYGLMDTANSMLGSVLNTVLFPAIARLQHRQEQLATAYLRSTGLIALFMLPVSIGAMVLAPELVDLLLGPRWHEVVLPFQILAVGMLFRTAYKMSDILAKGTGAVYRHAWRQGVYAAGILGGAWIGRHWGVPGVALSTLCALSLNFALMAHLSLKITALSWRALLATFKAPCFLAMLVGLVSWGAATALRSLGNSSLLVLAGTGLAVGASLLVILRLFPALLGRHGVWLLKLALDRLPGRRFAGIGGFRKRVERASSIV